MLRCYTGIYSYIQVIQINQVVQMLQLRQLSHSKIDIVQSTILQIID